jgi:hypothetical protein
VGERRTARLLAALERQGWAVLHDLALPGSRANIDHLMIGPGGVFVIDSKQYRGRLQLDPTGRLWHGRYPLTPTLRAVEFEADQAAQVLPDPGMAVMPIVAVHGTKVPWGKVVTDGVPVLPARRLPSMLRALPEVLGPERVAVLADQARVRFRAAAFPRRSVPRGWLVVEAAGGGGGELAFGPADEGVELPPVVEAVVADDAPGGDAVVVVGGGDGQFGDDL